MKGAEVCAATILEFWLMFIKFFAENASLDPNNTLLPNCSEFTLTLLTILTTYISSMSIMASSSSVGTMLSNHPNGSVKSKPKLYETVILIY
ncbi:hypothetical protein DICPUDRAFT_151617 [Dictyostelium purpureum]|uniref:Uncharacterized protein n=1 Tax=Dictyostelium purpureum TaxID=5786 RepID=F0ZJA8_DICPU|nr:uncharacterized protein DICPUDRAFT_151617 [Dictyostelium purpureum]EGC36002.1 hypothetical protein DICPUDRAFT_151617 [Dictyostelium purpureum]|eukprot:XP_003287503.1 hypothetical protein DICPUDRAFT_151617 [Dictyostelium purpureum]